MVVIRLTRAGTNKRPFYHVVAADRRKPRDGRFIERLGYFNPIAVGGEVRLQLNKERIAYWVAQGAQPSERITHLLAEFDNPTLRTEQLADKEKRKKRKAAKKAAAATAPTAAEDKPASATPPPAASGEAAQG